jgi:hypothetical protein
MNLFEVWSKTAPAVTPVPCNSKVIGSPTTQGVTGSIFLCELAPARRERGCAEIFTVPGFAFESDSAAFIIKLSTGLSRHGQKGHKLGFLKSTILPLGLRGAACAL